MQKNRLFLGAGVLLTAVGLLFSDTSIEKAPQIITCVLQYLQ